MRRALFASALGLASFVVACGGQNSPLFDDGDGGAGPASGSSGAGTPTSSSGATPTSSSAGAQTSSSSGGDPTSSSAGDGGSPGTGGAGSGGSGTGGSGTGGSGTGGAALCGDVVIGDPIPATVVLALDASGSMAGGDGSPEKWGPTTSAIESLVDVAPSDLQFGLVPFPAGDFDYDAACVDFNDPACVEYFADGGCDDVRADPAVEIAPLEDSGPAIVEWMEERTPEGGTPTYWALRRAYEVAGGAPGAGDRFVVLFTDGVPNVYAPEQDLGGGFVIPESNIECRDLEDIVEEAADAAAGSRPIRTYVVGAPGSEEGAAFLSDLAVAGGTATPGCDPGECHVQIGAADYEDDLAAALADIAGKAAGCRFEVPLDDLNDLDLVDVSLETGRGDVDVDRDPDHVEGWDLVDDDPTTIELYGTACELYREEASNVVRVQLRCEA